MLQRMTQGVEPLTHLWLDARGVGPSVCPRVPTTLRSVVTRESTGQRAHSYCARCALRLRRCHGGLEGNTSLAGLYAVGEVAATGVHGANRLASNSLTEAVIAGRRLGERLAAATPRTETSRLAWRASRAGHGVDSSTRDSRARQMSTHAGFFVTAWALSPFWARCS